MLSTVCIIRFSIPVVMRLLAQWRTSSMVWKSRDMLSPVFADLHGMPPTLFVSGTRDLLLGDTSTLHRTMLRAGVDARLVVFEALPHAFWYHFEFPETREALQLAADFLAEKVAR